MARHDCSSPDDGPKREPWYWTEAMEAVRAVEALVRPLGLFTSLTGGVLYRGHSKKDLDLVFAQLSGERGPFPASALDGVLEGLGWTRFRTGPDLEAWRLRAGFPADCWMHTVECWVTPENRRVDVFRWEEQPPSWFTRAWRWISGPMRPWTT